MVATVRKQEFGFLILLLRRIRLDVTTDRLPAYGLSRGHLRPCFAREVSTAPISINDFDNGTDPIKDLSMLECLG